MYKNLVEILRKRQYYSGLANSMIVLYPLKIKEVILQLVLLGIEKKVKNYIEICP